MKKNAISNSRIVRLNTRPFCSGNYVLYWMQQSQRAEDNSALEFAILKANELKLPVLVCFGLTCDYPQANLRHYLFMLQGLKETQITLSKRGIQLVVQKGKPDEQALLFSKKASAVVCDRGYLRHQKAWRANLASEAPCAVFQVEGDVIVPVESASNKVEYAARTLRPKIDRIVKSYLSKWMPERVRYPVMDLASSGVDLSKPMQLCETLPINRDVSEVSKFFIGGTSRAKKMFNLFLEKKCANYDKHHNQPQTDDTSLMSPYLHFGQISPRYLASKIQSGDHLAPTAREAFLEQLIVRRELAMNYTHFHPAYDRYEGLPTWARQTLRDHSGDTRPVRYDLKTLEGAKTHDAYWNAAMREMIFSGYMHNYMRMYWGKKILEWTSNPRKAYSNILYLNNKYFLDGRDPNSYAGVAWIFGLHDRPWKERAVFGKVRYMAASGLERKCDVSAYIAKIDRIVQRAA